MRVLYAIQGTGNGHLSRARDIIPVLQKKHEVEILVSGSHAEVELPFPVKYRFNGLGFIFGANGGIDILETYKKNYIKVLLTEINSLPVNDYDLVINDFEPVSAWACYLKNKKCISVSHQAAVLNKEAPQPKDIDILGKAILKNYAPSSVKYGFHFKAYAGNIFTPVIRKQVRAQTVLNHGHYTVYLPAYDDQRIRNVLQLCGNTRWQVFSKHNKTVIRENNISIRPISNDAFIESMATSEGVLCGAGFETPAEALYLKKKLMVIPMKGQFEQQCNAAALNEMGVPVIRSLKPEYADEIIKWIANGQHIEVNYPDSTEEIIDKILSAHTCATTAEPTVDNEYYFSAKKFRNMVLHKILAQI